MLYVAHSLNANSNDSKCDIGDNLYEYAYTVEFMHMSRSF